MDKILSTVLTRFAIAAAAIALISVVIWFAGPLLAFAGYEPLTSEWARIGLILFVIGLFGLVWLWRYLRARRASAALQKGLTSAEEGAKEAQVLSRRMSDALATLKRMGGRGRRSDYLYARPWYMIIGPPGTGKTTALVNSGLKFLISDDGGAQAMQGVGGTRNCDWWFTDDAILVDTAGRYTTQDSDAERDRKAWLSFLSLLRRNRPAQPLNGVMVAFGFDLLLNASAEELRAHAGAVRRRLNELHKELGVRLPVYVWLTKADIVPGFVEFFDDLTADGRREVLGATWPWDGAAPLKIEVLLDQFDQTVKSLTERAPDRLQAEADAGRRSKVLGFATQVAEARARLATFFGAMFEVRPLEPTPVFRGFYLTSGTQTGAAIDRLLGVMSPARIAPSRRGKSSTGRAYFLHRLLQDVMFPEAGLVSADPRVRARRRTLLVGGLAMMALITAGMLALWLLAYQRNGVAQERLAASVTPFAEARAKSGVDPTRVTVSQKGFEEVAGLLDQLRALPGGYDEAKGQGVEAPLGDLGLSQAKSLNAASLSAYRQGLQRMLLPRLILRAEDAVVAAQDDDWRDLYEALRVYLQIGATADGVTASGMRDAAGVRTWYVRTWSSADFPGGENKALRDRLLSHFDALLEQPADLLDAVAKIESQTIGNPKRGPVVDWDLIKSTQDQLASRSLEERVLTAMESEAAGKPEWVLKDKLLAGQERAFASDVGAVSVPFLYTKQGYETIYLAFSNDILARIQDEQWVLGDSGKKEAVSVQAPVLKRELAATYAKAYVDRWIEVMRGVTPLGLKSVGDAVELTKKPQPISRFLGAVVAETALVPADQQPAEAQGQAGVIISQRFAELALYVNGAGDAPGEVKRLEGALENVRKAMEAGGGGGGGGGGGAGGGGAALQQAVQELAAAVQSMPGDAGAIGAGLTQSAGDTATTQARNQLATAYQNEILPICRQATKFYPFAGPGAADAPIADFQRVFGPGGILTSFLESRLGPYIDKSGTTWKARSGDDVARSLSSRSLASLQMADTISQAMFRSPYGVGALGFRVEIRAVALGTDVQSARLALGGLQSFDYTAPGAAFTFEWVPGPGMDLTALTVTGRDPALPPLQYQPQRGVWSLFRLLDSGDCRPCTAKTRNYTFGEGTMAVTLNVRVVDGAAAGEPFDKAKLWKFKCPAAL